MNAAFKLLQGMGLNRPGRHLEMLNKFNSITAVGESGAGMVKATMNASGKLISVDIDSQLMGKDKKVIEDLVVAACNEARDQSLQLAVEEMAKMQAESPEMMNMMQSLINGMNNQQK